jgi:hypothetical protein
MLEFYSAVLPYEVKWDECIPKTGKHLIPMWPTPNAIFEVAYSGTERDVESGFSVPVLFATGDRVCGVRNYAVHIFGLEDTIKISERNHHYVGMLNTKRGPFFVFIKLVPEGI